MRNSLARSLSTSRWSGTFHAIGARLLREYALDIGLDSSFTIHDREDSADLMNLLRHDLGFSEMEKRFPMKGTCLSIYSRVVNAEAPLGEVLGNFFPWCAEWEAELRKLLGAYVEAKQTQNVLDYDDLLLYWAQIMIEGAVAEDIARRFDHVLIDEYQDTNRLQASILLGLKPNGRGLTTVEDATKPSPTGSTPIANTIGMVVVADFAARAAAEPPAVIMATWRRTRSAASAGNRSIWPSANRNSSATLRPST
jgi:superfamily I DNA/RNA helicase